MRIAFVGDIHLGGDIGKLCNEHGDHFPFAQVEDALARFDPVVGNLECCLVDSSNSVETDVNPFAVRGSMAREIRRSGFHALNLANNHILDCGVRALEVTIDRLEDAGIAHFGAGPDLERAGESRWLERDGHRLAFIGACDRSSCYAAPARAGVLPVIPPMLGSRVREAARQADLVTVSLHADLEFVCCPAPWRIRLCRWLIEQGAHLVICHHPHVVQGLEEYRGGLIAYSLGNFVFKIQDNAYQERHPGTAEGVILGVDVTFGDGGPRLSPELIPVRITDEHRPVPVHGPEAEKMLLEIDRRSAVIRDPDAVRREWRASCRREVRRAFLAAYYAIRRGQHGNAVRILRDMVIEPESRRWLLGRLTGGFR